MIEIVVACLVLCGCSSESDLAIPDDWATETIPQATIDVSGDCADVLPYEFVTGGIHIGNPSPWPNEPMIWLDFEYGPNPTCTVELKGPPFAFSCHDDGPLRHWVNRDERECQGFADVAISGSFGGPRNASVNLTYAVTDCPCDTSCAPFPAPCTLNALMTYADP